MKNQRLVRARPKSLEYLPDWAKCCDEVISVLTNSPDMTLDLDNTSLLSNHGACRWCGTKYPADLQEAHEGVLDVEANKYVQLAVLDLDEGPTAELQSDKYVESIAK